MRLSPQMMIKKMVDAGFSQIEISKQSGVTQPTISRILSGAHKDPKNSVVEKLRDTMIANNIDSNR